MRKLFIAGTFLMIFLALSCEKEPLGSNSDQEQVVFEEIEFYVSKHILPGYFVTAIDFDSKGKAWIGTFGQGLIKYDGNLYTVYNSENSTFPVDQKIWDLKVDYKDNVWIGSDGLIKYNGETFEVFNTSNSPLMENFVTSIDVDENNVLWLASCRHS